MTVEIWQLILSIVSIILVVMALIATHHRFTMGLIQRVQRECEQETKALHQRVNDVRDAYVRKEDLNIHLRPLMDAMQSMRDEVHRITLRIDDVIKDKNSGSKET